MLQVKIFKNLEFHYDETAEELNNWIRENQIDVVDIRVQLSPQSPGAGAPVGGDHEESDLLCYVVYRAE